MTIKHSKTSVIIPCHNYGRYISLCIESVLSQTKPALEIIIINDSSTDNTEEIISSRYSDHVKYYEVSYKNAQKSRNFAIEKAKGEFFYLLDADDYLDSKALEILENALQSNPSCKLAYSARYNFGDFELIKKGGFNYITHFQNFSINNLKKRNFIPMHSLIRKSYFSGFDDRINKLQDWEAWLNFLKKDSDAVYIDLPLFFYRFHGNNMTSTQNNEYFERLKILVKHSLVSYSEFLHSSQNSIPINKCIIILHSPEKTNFTYLIDCIKKNKDKISQFYITGNKTTYSTDKLLERLNNYNIPAFEYYDQSPDLVLQELRVNSKIFLCKQLIISNFSSNDLNSIASENDHYQVYSSVEKEHLLQYKSFSATDTLVFNKTGISLLLDIPSLVQHILNILNKNFSMLLSRHVLWRLKHKNL